MQGSCAAETPPIYRRSSQRGAPRLRAVAPGTLVDRPRTGREHLDEGEITFADEQNMQRPCTHCTVPMGLPCRSVPVQPRAPVTSPTAKRRIFVSGRVAWTCSRASRTPSGLEPLGGSEQQHLVDACRVTAKGSPRRERDEPSVPQLLRVGGRQSPVTRDRVHSHDGRGLAVGTETRLLAVAHEEPIDVPAPRSPVPFARFVLVTAADRGIPDTHRQKSNREQTTNKQQPLSSAAS